LSQTSKKYQVDAAGAMALFGQIVLLQDRN